MLSSELVADLELYRRYVWTQSTCFSSHVVSPLNALKKMKNLNRVWNKILDRSLGMI